MKKTEEKYDNYKSTMTARQPEMEQMLYRISSGLVDINLLPTRRHQDKRSTTTTPGAHQSSCPV